MSRFATLVCWIIAFFCFVEIHAINGEVPSDDRTVTPFGLRLWLDTSGEHVTEAEFVAFAGDAVRLRRENGRELTVPISRLSQEDQAFVRQFSEGHEATAATWAALFRHPGDGLTAEYFTDTARENQGLTRIDPAIDFVFGQNQPPYRGGVQVKPRDGWYENFAVRWTGRIMPRFSETYTFHLTADDGALLWIDDQLLIQAWEWKGAVEYTGRVALTAGKPARIKLLYHNGPFGGSIKLEWSSASQTRQVVPTEVLYQPAADEVPQFAPGPSLAGLIETHAIELSAPVKCAPRGGWGVPNAVTLFPLPDGACKLGWNDAQGAAHISTLSSDGDVVGDDLIVPDFDLRGLHVHADGAMGLLGAELPDRMCLLRLNAKGERQFRTVLTGGKGRVLHERFLDDLWTFSGRLAASGQEYAAHFGHAWQTEPKVAHQGGYFATIDFKGKIGVEHAWTVSHSLDQQVIRHRGAFLTLSLGDVYPKGLWMQNRTLNLGRVIYPSSDHLEAWTPEGARLGSLCPAGRHTATVFLSKEEGQTRVVYLLVNDELEVLHSRRLLDDVAGKVQSVRLAPFGQQLLLAWREDESGAKVALIDTLGRLLNEPVWVDATLPKTDELATFANGDVSWVAAQDGQRQVTLIKIMNPTPLAPNDSVASASEAESSAEEQSVELAPATLIVRLPPDAELEAQGVAIPAKGTLRRLKSPPLEPGKPFSYTLKVTWREAGQSRNEERKVAIAAGEEVVVDFGPDRLADDELSDAERSVLRLTNAQRKAAGAPPLLANRRLFAAARAHSANMARQGKMAHTLDEQEFWQRIEKAGYHAGASGENIAQAPSPQGAMDMWMQSEGHKANILNADYGEIGIGVAKGSDGRVYYTQVFAAPSGG